MTGHPDGLPELFEPKSNSGPVLGETSPQFNTTLGYFPSAEGDLWRTAAQGGPAQRLTTHAAAETHAAISPDGKWVAFAGSYEGAQDAYVMPLAGGLPKRQGSRQTAFRKCDR